MTASASGEVVVLKFSISVNTRVVCIMIWRLISSFVARLAGGLPLLHTGMDVSSITSTPILSSNSLRSIVISPRNIPERDSYEIDDKELDKKASPPSATRNAASVYH